MSNINSDSEKQVQDLLHQVNFALNKNIAILQDLNHKIAGNSGFRNVLDTANKQLAEFQKQLKVPDDFPPHISRPNTPIIQMVIPGESTRSNK